MCWVVRQGICEELVHEHSADTAISLDIKGDSYLHIMYFFSETHTHSHTTHEWCGWQLHNILIISEQIWMTNSTAQCR